MALSLRYGRIDHIWFTLMHELAHIKKNGKHAGHLDNNLVGPSAEVSEDKPPIEQEADRIASNWLIPQDEIDAFISRTKPYFSKNAMIEFAESVRVHPGIVVGRLHHLKTISHSHSREMLVSVRDQLMEATG